MVSLITSLYGQCEFVAIRDSIAEQEAVYQADLHVRQFNHAYIVDMSPGDGLVVAVVSNVPIIIANDVLSDL
jgi:bifunctional DNase/RNase